MIRYSPTMPQVKSTTCNGRQPNRIGCRLRSTIHSRFYECRLRALLYVALLNRAAVIVRGLAVGKVSPPEADINRICLLVDTLSCYPTDRIVLQVRTFANGTLSRSIHV